MYLTPADLYELTHYRRKSAQIRALIAMGIEHAVRPDGTPAVHVSAVQARRRFICKPDNICKPAAP